MDQVVNHCSLHAPLPDCQSAYRQHHSTETALVKIHSDIMLNMDRQKCTLLVLLDLSAAFDTVEHEMLLNRLQQDFGITGTALTWLSSYLSLRTQQILVQDTMSEKCPLDCGVPQGSCLGPILFMLYASQLFEIVAEHLPDIHSYADDTQLYIAFDAGSPASEAAATASMQACVSAVRAWMVQSKLMINDSKTEILVIGTRQQLMKSSIDSVIVGETPIELSVVVKNLGVHINSNMSMSTHIGKLCAKAYWGLYNIRQIRKFLDVESTKTLVNAFIISHVDYCNALLSGLPSCMPA